MAREHKITIVLDEVAQSVTVGDMIDMEEGKRSAVVRVMARFTWRDGEKLSEEDAFRYLRALNLEEFDQYARQFKEAMEGIGVPKGNES